MTGTKGVFLGTDSTTSHSHSVVAKYLSSAEPAGELPFETHRLLVPYLAAGMEPEDLPPHMKVSSMYRPLHPLAHGLADGLHLFPAEGFQ